jgi:pyridoxine 5-phosphate synthase
MNNKIRLGINIDHVATIRNARGGNHPDPVRAALIAQKSGADSITAHLREDRRHISDEDIRSLINQISVPLNLEMAPTDEMLEIACTHQPYATCLVPEKREEITTEGGLDVIQYQKKLEKFVNVMSKKNIRVCLFIEPNIKQVEASYEIGAPVIEFHVGSYCNNFHNNLLINEREKLLLAIQKADELGIECHAGHGIGYEHVQSIASIKSIKELNIGHFLIGESIFLGLENAIKKMRLLVDSVR